MVLILNLDVNTLVVDMILSFNDLTQNETILDVIDPVLESVLSLNDLRIRNETI